MADLFGQTGFVGVFSDVSMLRKLEKERIALESSRREEAETARRLQEEFIDGEWMSRLKNNAGLTGLIAIQ